jgi:hypothetical protein
MTARFPSPPRPPKRYWRDCDWFDAHDSQLAEQYPNQWIAVLSEKVISHSNSLEHVLKEVEEQGAVFPAIGFVERGIHVYKNLSSIFVLKPTSFLTTPYQFLSVTTTL